MTEGRVARRYASALYSAAKKSNAVEAVESDLISLVQTIRDSDHFRGFIINPEIVTEQKVALIERVFGERFSDLTYSFIRLILRKRREDSLGLVQQLFTELRRQNEGVAHIFVTSAQPLSQTHKSAVVEKLAQRTNRRIEAEFDVDPQLIGGVRVAYDDFIIDGTVRGNLARLRKKIVRDLLKQA